ncbi:MAG: hypothetical protein ACKOAU_11640, partial [Pirellula sp.]
MQRTQVSQFLESLSQLPKAWNDFWFSAIPPERTTRVRQVFAVPSAILFAMSVAWVPQWLSADGWFGLDAGYYLIGDGRPDTGSQYRWSILYLLTSSSVAAAVCVAGLAASGLMFFGIGGRAAPLLAWICLLMIHHRAPWLTLPAEVLGLAGLLYLAIAPGNW